MGSPKFQYGPIFHLFFRFCHRIFVRPGFSEVGKERTETSKLNFVSGFILLLQVFNEAGNDFSGLSLTDTHLFGYFRYDRSFCDRGHGSSVSGGL
jgi:hypothetical protein